jgi:murein L,D-transpeptidase YcbB/YkuD
MLKLTIVILFLILCFTSCNDSNKLKEETLEPVLIKKTDLKIDSSFMVLFYKHHVISDSIQKETNRFYIKRHYKLAWFSKNGMNYAISIFYNQLQNYKYNFSDSSFYNSDLDLLMKELLSDELKFLAQENKVQKLDVLLTTTFFKYAKNVYGGLDKNLNDLEWYIPRQYKNYQSTLDSLVLISKDEQERIPLNKGYFLLKDKLKKYRDIEKTGGLPIITSSPINYKIGISDSNLISAKKYFYLTGDLKNKDETVFFTDSLLNAIKNFQQRLGLVVNGNLDSATVSEINVPVSDRIKQLIINMERLRWAPIVMENKYIFINIPEFKLYFFDYGHPVWNTNIIVGKTATQTTIFKGNISQIILNPYWGVPSSIANNDMLPRIKKNSNYLIKNNIEVFLGNKVINPSTINWSLYKENLPFFLRQKPGKNNALGRIKFLFPNTYDIYLHDTPSKELFGDTKRDFSHGCVRVANPKILALYLLKNNTIWNKQKINKILLTDNETKIPITPTIPIYMMYFTAWVDSSGQLNFRNDIYNLDSKILKEIFSE